MTQNLLVVQDLTLTFPHKTCFEEFSVRVHQGERIGIVGQNGSGKSHLLRLLCERMPAHRVGFVPQIIETFDSLSGAQRFQKALSAAVAKDPEMLLLDEPTNHLDQRNKQSLMRMLDSFAGTLVAVSHDVEFLRRCVQTVWHIGDARVSVYAGFSDYQVQVSEAKKRLEARLDALQCDKRHVHDGLMRDQERAKKRRIHGEKKYDGDKLALRSAQGRGQLTTNKNRKRISGEKDAVLRELKGLRLPEVLTPTFSLSAAQLKSRCPVVTVRDGACGYEVPLLEGLYCQLGSEDRVHVKGNNGTGKTTFIRAIMCDPLVQRSGDWQAPARHEIGYLDQHYANLNPEMSAFEVIQEAAPHLTRDDIRDHLNAFLLRKNEEVFLQSRFLSGGEKARLSLAQIAARAPRLLILDELTNNLDLETREHVIQVLNAYPGAVIAISHDNDFIQRMGVTTVLEF